MVWKNVLEPERQLVAVLYGACACRAGCIVLCFQPLTQLFPLLYQLFSNANAQVKKLGRAVSYKAIHWATRVRRLNYILLYRYHILPYWMSYEHEPNLGHDLLWDILRTVRHFWPQNLRFRTLDLRKIILGNSYKMSVELVLFEQLVPVLGKFLFVLALDCQ